MNTTHIETPYRVYPNFLLTHQTRGVYRTSTPSIYSSGVWHHDLQFLNDTEGGGLGWLKKHKWVVGIGGGMLLVLIIASENNTSTPTDSGVTDAQSGIIARYNLDTYVAGVVAQDAYKMYTIETSNSKDSGVLQLAGVGSVNEITYTLAHIAAAWNLNDANASSLDIVFGGLTTSSISWKDYTDTLIVNGPNMKDYTSLEDTAAALAGLQKTLGTQTALNLFNTMGAQLADPNTQLNIAMGGAGSIRTLVTQEGFVNALQKVTEFVKANTTPQ